MGTAWNVRGVIVNCSVSHGAVDAVRTCVLCVGCASVVILVLSGSGLDRETSLMPDFALALKPPLTAGAVEGGTAVDCDTLANFLFTFPNLALDVVDPIVLLGA